MAITKQKYIIGGTLQTPTRCNRNIAFISSGGGANTIVSAFQARVAAAGSPTFFEASTCLTNTIQSFLNIDLAP
jgi:hypothetical protein